MTGNRPGDREIGRQASCVGKVRFNNRKSARRARNSLKGAGAVNIYPCSFCGYLHLGRMPQDVRNGSTDKTAWQWRRGVGR